VTKDQVVAVGFLTNQDLELLETGFKRHFPIGHDDMFADLLAKLDHVEASPLGKGVALQIK
jgi:hypothetical protein